MEKLSIEEKAKRFDEALGKARRYYDEYKTRDNILYVEDMEDMFPELKESEDERIRKDMIETIKKESKDFPSSVIAEKSHTWIAWLEKQGEQKSVPDWMPKFLDELRSKKNYFDWDEHRDIEGGILAIIKWMNPNYFNGKDGEQEPADKVEPKFHEGEWVVYECGEETATLQITRIVGETYVFSDDSTLGVVDEDTLRLWDITKDAKDGDVLVTKKKNIFIFKSISGCTIYDYCGLYFGKFMEYSATVNGRAAVQLPIDYAPATKEQRDTLEKAITNAGYRWDKEKLKLEKV